MKWTTDKKLLAVITLILACIGIVASLVVQYSQVSVFKSALAATCDSEGRLDYHQAVKDYAAGRLKIERHPDLANNRVTVTIVNSTGCSIPVSLGSYKLFEAYNPATVSQQEFFDGTATVLVQNGSSATLSVNLPPCEAQYDLWYGDVVHVQIDNHPYGELLAGDQVRLGQYCERPSSPPPPPQPPTSSSRPTLRIIKRVINNSDGGDLLRPSDFMIHVTTSNGRDISGSPARGTGSPGRSYRVSPGRYRVWEEEDSDYDVSFSGDCDDDGRITMGSRSKTCIITNNDVPRTRFYNPPPPVSYPPPPIIQTVFAAPELPDTGIGPDDNTISLLFFYCLGILLFATIVTGTYKYVSAKK